MRIRVYAALVVSSGWLIGGLCATAAPIAHDSFSYPDGDLAGAGDGAGWAGAWHDIHPDGAPKTFVLAPGLEYADGDGVQLATAGSQVGIAYDTSRKIDLDTASRPELAGVVADGKLGVDGPSVWISLLARCESGYGWSVVELNAGTREQVKLCHAGDSENWGFIDTATRETDTPVTEPVFILVRIDFRADDDAIHLWIDPSLASEPDAETADATGAYPDAAFDTVVIRGDSTDETYIDELRIGTTWADVCPPKE